MKKLVILFLALLMVFGLTGCPGGNKSSGEEIKIGVIIYDFKDLWMTDYRTEMERYVKEDLKGNYVIDIRDGEDNQTTQTGIVDSFIAEKFDVIIVNMVNPEAADVVVNKCKDANIPVILINTEPDPAFLDIWPGKQSYVGANAADSGTMQGEIIVGLDDKGDMNGSGVVEYIMLTGNPANIDAPLRTEFSIKALTDAGIQVKELEKHCAMWFPDQAETAMSDFLVKYKKGDIDVVFANNDGMAMGALAALENAGWKVGEDVYLVGVDATDEARDAIKSGRMTGTVFNDHISQSHKAIDVALDAVAGKDVLNKYYVPYSPVVN